MNERERLIEILKDNQGDSTYYMTDEAVQSVSDVLLDNGVVVLPCKVGDTVYIVHNTAESIDLDCSETCIYETVIDSIHISGIVEYHMFYKKIIHPDCDFFSDKDIGKTVFLTKEEAEKALKGGEEE